MACFIFLQAMGKAVESTALSMPLSDILTFLIAAYLIVKTYRSLGGKPYLTEKRRNLQTARTVNIS